MKRLAVFARAPVRGRVKTRLARDIGADAALAAYRELLASTLSRLGGGGGFRMEIWVDGASPEVAAWRQRHPVRVQPQGDLGARMAAAFADGVAALVGSDIPTLTADYVDAALDALASVDLVLGPTADGGYCLIAMNEPHPEVFHDIPWSTDAVLTATLGAAGHLSVKLLDELWDVDGLADWQRWRAMPQASCA